VGTRKPKAEVSIDEKIGANIKRARLLAGVSQTQLGDALSISFQQIQKYERGGNRTPVARLFPIAAALNVSIEDLLAGTPGFEDDADGRIHASKEQLSAISFDRRTVRWLKIFERLPDQRTQMQLLHLAEMIADLAQGNDTLPRSFGPSKANAKRQDNLGSTTGIK